MAASAWHRAVDTANTPSPYASLALPTGPCNFRNLTSGSRAPICGCRKFWLDEPINTQDGSCRCACGHHACYHDDVPVRRRAGEDTTLPGATPVIDQVQFNSAHSGLTQNSVGRNGGLLTGLPVRQPNPVSQSTDNPSTTGPAGGLAAQTGVWGGLNAFARWQHDPTWVPSTAPPSVMSCDTKFQPSNVFNKPAPIERPYTSMFPNMEDLMASPTVRGTPTTEEFDSNLLRIEPANSRHSEQIIQAAPTQPLKPSTSEIQIWESPPKVPIRTTNKTDGEMPTTPIKNVAPTHDWQNKVQSCMRRLEELENMSFSHVPAEEIQDKFELFDSRLLELEYWKKDVEARFSTSITASDDSSTSQTSTSLPDCDLSKGSLALLSRVSDMEQRLVDLETSRPSYACPWEIEVVLLPFGRRLNGIWHEFADEDEKQHPDVSRKHNDKPKPTSGLLALSQNKEAAWTPDSIQAWAKTINPLLWPKAPGPKNTVFKRLQSRGLVRTVALTDTGAHGIWESVRDTFSDFIEAQPHHHPGLPQNPYQGLNEPFVPLRKVRKSSWLRYLSPHELITPATWDMAFLDSGVFMHGKGGHKRLYLTTAEAYIQSGKSGWTWQEVRDLPRGESEDADVLPSKEDHCEPCWEHVPSLDDIPSVNASFASCYSGLSEKRRSTCVTFADDQEDLENQSPRSDGSESSADAVTPRQPNSFPVIVRKISQSKRRNSPSCTPVAYQKRRRMSSSPGYRGGPEELTPRWSHEPPTPSLMDALWETRSQGLAGVGRKRVSSPLAYATPHSHNVTNVHLAMADGGDTEAESTGSTSPDSENEWAGLDDEDEDKENNEPIHPSSRPSSRSSSFSGWNGLDLFGQDGSDDEDNSHEP